jgi:hypothetical protein
MEMQQMLAHLLAETRSTQEEMRADHEKMMAEWKADRVKREADFKITACQITKEACPEKMELNPGMMEAKVERQEVPTEDSAAKSFRIMKKLHRGRCLAAGRHMKPKKLTRGDCGCQGKLAATCRKVSHHAAVAWRKRSLSRNIRPVEIVDP